MKISLGIGIIDVGFNVISSFQPMSTGSVIIEEVLICGIGSTGTIVSLSSEGFCENACETAMRGYLVTSRSTNFEFG